MERLAMQPEQVWQAALGQLQLEMPKTTFDTWVRGASLLTHEDGSYVIGVNNAYAKDWLENRLRATIKRTLSGIVGRTVEVRFVVWTTNGNGKNGHSQGDGYSNGHGYSEGVEKTARLLDSGPLDPHLVPAAPTLNPKYKFESFVVGPS